MIQAIRWMLQYRIHIAHIDAHTGTHTLIRLDTYTGTYWIGTHRDLPDYTDARRLPYTYSETTRCTYILDECALTSLSELCWWSSIFDNVTNLPCFTLITKELYWCFRDTNKERELWSHSNDRRLIYQLQLLVLGYTMNNRLNDGFYWSIITC